MNDTASNVRLLHIFVNLSILVFSGRADCGNDDHPLPDRGGVFVDVTRSDHLANSHGVKILLPDPDEEPDFSFLALEEPLSWRIGIAGPSFLEEGSFWVTAATATFELTSKDDSFARKSEMSLKSIKIDALLARSIIESWVDFVRLTRWGDRNPHSPFTSLGGHCFVAVNSESGVIGTCWFETPVKKMTLLTRARELSFALKEYAFDDEPSDSNIREKLDLFNESLRRANDDSQ